jgi:DNA repair exonuclease SbcCD nuclease subunit
MKLLAVGDLHYSDQTPVCRTDDYQESCNQVLREIWGIAKEHEVSLIVFPGDIFDRPRPPYSVVADLMDEFCGIPDGAEILTVPGQHDLPNHEYSARAGSGYGMIVRKGWIAHDVPSTPGPFIPPHFLASDGIVIVGGGWNDYPRSSVKAEVMITHRMVFDKEESYPGAQGEATDLMKKYPGVRWFLCGDNHNRVVVEADGQTLINPGSVMIRTAAQADHKPSVFVIDRDEETWEEIPLKAALCEVRRDHLVHAEEQKARTEKLMESFRETVSVELDFRSNVQNWLEANAGTVADLVRRVIVRSLDNGLEFDGVFSEKESSNGHRD